MPRVIIMPADVAGAPLAELKDWLAITGAAEDALLTALLRAALDMCEAFTGTVPLEVVGEETIAAPGGWQRLSTRPIQAIVGVDAITSDRARIPLDPAAYALDLEADGGALVRIVQPGGAGRVAVRFSAGLAADWPALPPGLRHGIVRLAAHHYRERDSGAAAPPAAVAALWRPWRRLRVA